MSPRAAPNPPAPRGRAGAVHGDGSAAARVHGADPPRIGSGGSDLEQIKADQQLILRIAAEGFDGPAWQQLVEHVYDYGRRSLHSFIHDGLMVARARRAVVNQPGAAETVRKFLAATEVDYRHLRDEAVNEAIASALSYWRRRVIPEGRWDPGEGAQLRTYFVNLALMRLVKVAQRHLRRLRTVSPVDPQKALIDRELQASDAHTRGARSAYERIDAADAAAARLRELDLTDTDRQIFELTAEGLTQQEIADRLGLVSAKAVESRVARCRRRIRAS